MGAIVSGRFVWLDDDDRAHLLRAAGHLFDDELAALLSVVMAWDEAPADPLLAFIEATRDRRAFGDAEWQVETIAVGLRALGMPPRD